MMAMSRVVLFQDLDPGIALNPERYDPRRRQFDQSGVLLTEICALIREGISNTSKSYGSDSMFCVMDTSGAREGFITIEREPIPKSEIASQKKRAQAGDVLISRLRPYLRQVALVDPGAIDWDRTSLACSTEFYVLRSIDESSIAFLVPYLLSESVQAVLEASQEGGHHPRVGENTLRSLRVPQEIVDNRDELSAAVALAARKFRDATNTMSAMVKEV